MNGMNVAPFIHMIKTPLSTYFYDVNTNKIIEVSAEVYNFLKSVARGTETQDAFENSEADNRAQTVRRVEELKKEGYLSAKRPVKCLHGHSDLLEYHLDSNIEQVTLQLTQQCNFRCAYCVYTVENFDYQRHHSPKKMPLEVALKTVDFFVNHSANQKEVCIGFYGGEPLLEFETIKAVVTYAREEFAGKKLKYTITTNGSLFTFENMGFLEENKFDITVSLDGTPEIHNKSRKFAANGEGTFSAIETNLRIMKESFPALYKKVNFNVVLDPRNACFDLYAFFNENELFSANQIRSTLVDDFFSIEKVVETEAYSIESRILQFKALLSLLKRYPDNKVSNLVRSTVASAVEKTETEMREQKELPDVTSHSGPCIPGQRRLFVDIHGDFYPCERVSETSDVMKIGGLESGFDYDKARALLNVSQLTEKECRTCWAIRHCILCARFCDNNSELSAELKLSNCGGVRSSVDNKLRDYIALKELKDFAKGERYERK
ncbi:MAG: Cys-rich peptide radical SAM maturase CcpM [Clostridiales bacterium]|jgi:uncharacterized protein|nr:Cys-rich peptide radical SAM maturase CcpM [Clostridiales bacterium]